MVMMKARMMPMEERMMKLEVTVAVLLLLKDSVMLDFNLGSLLKKKKKNNFNFFFFLFLFIFFFFLFRKKKKSWPSKKKTVSMFLKQNRGQYSISQVFFFFQN